MAGSAQKQIEASRQCGGVLSRVAYHRAKHDGVGAAALIGQAGLTTEVIEDRNARLAVADQIKFVGLVADALGDKHLGLHLACDHDVRETGLLYYVAASADTLGDALRRAERYSAIQTRA
jgi:Arabinose-binding domain of AraC transcription regulator, N-term